MGLAALYDIHGNLPALEAVLEEVRRSGVDGIVVGGDVLPGPMPRETLERLLTLELPTHFIVGNGEVAVLEQMAGRESAAVPEAYRPIIRWTARQLSLENQRVMAAWPKVMRLEIPELGAILFCHGTPRNENECFTRLTSEEELLPIFAGAGAPTVICGHTHMQFDRAIGRTRVVNAGSVGMPFGEPGAYWALLGPDIQLRRTQYDLAKAARRVRATAYPHADEFAAHSILQPPSEQQMTQAFTRAALVQPSRQLRD